MCIRDSTSTTIKFYAPIILLNSSNSTSFTPPALNTKPTAIKATTKKPISCLLYTSMPYQTLKDVMKQQKGREEQCRKQGCWWKREEQLAKKQHHTCLLYTSSDKHLVYHFSIGTLLFVFVAVLLLLNIKQLMRTDWEHFSLRCV